MPFDEAQAWDWHKDAEGMTCAYVSLDLTGIAKQGPGGADFNIHVRQGVLDGGHLDQGAAVGVVPALRVL